MYITNQGYTYYEGTEQCHSRAPFLILVHCKELPLGKNNFRAFVRKVALHQLGHWMMGVARIHGQSIIVSGDYGADGLTKTVSKELFEKATPVPEHLYEAWNKGEGWNSAGSEASAMKEWACETFKDRL